MASVTDLLKQVPDISTKCDQKLVTSRTVSEIHANK